METLELFLQRQAPDGLVPWSRQQEAAEKFGRTLSEVEGAILEAGLWPARYQRNRETFDQQQQRRFFRSAVAVIGCGGLGGYIIEELARLGVGKIVAVDHDLFDEHNLNRQLLSSPRLLGTAKVEAAAARVAEINPAVTLVAVRERFDRGNGGAILRQVDVAADALDSIASRLELADACEEARIPLVHGAIAGWYGQLLTQFPGDGTLQRLYGDRESGVGAERRLGNPSFTPAAIASMEVAAICKVLLGLPTGPRNQLLTVNFLDMTIEPVPLPSSSAADLT